MTAERIFVSTGMLRRACMTGAWIPLSIRMIVDLDFSATQLLLMGAAIETGLLLSEIPSGVVADVISRKWSVVIGTFILGAAQFAAGLADEWVLFMAIQFVWGIGWSFISGAEVAWITDEVGSATDTEPLILRRARFEFAAVIVGLIVFAAIGQYVSLQGAVLLAGALGVAWAITLAVIMPETNFVPHPAGERANAFAQLLRDGARFTLSTRGLSVLAAVMILGGVAAETIDRSEIRRLEDIGLSTGWAPVLVVGAIMVAKALIGALLLWRFEGKVSGTGVVVGFAVLLAATGVGVLAFAHVSVVVFAAAILIAQGALLDLTDPLITTWTNSFAPTEIRATVHSFIGQSRALGEIGGGVLMGAVIAATTLPIALTIAAGLFGLAALLALQARAD